MLGLKSLKKVVLMEKVPIFNVHLKITGWEGPFGDYNEFRHVVRGLNYLGDSSTIAYKVMENGKLVPGLREGLHTYSGEIDLGEMGLHIHYNGGGIGPLLREGDSVFLLDEKMNYENGMKRKPRYTLQGLYETLTDNRMNTKIKRLEEELKEQDKYKFNTNLRYQFNSIVKHKETKVKLLENAYRRRVSNQ